MWNDLQRYIRAVAVLIAALSIGGCASHAGQGLRAPAAHGLPATPLPTSQSIGTVEADDPVLSAVLETARRSPGCETLAAAGARYYQLGILDRAAAHYAQAVDVNRRCAVGHEGLARVWRDSGYAAQALASAHRATHAAPASATARNVLGTILQDLGRVAEARAAYEQAAALDPSAPYAYSNLCYLAYLEANVAVAEAACQRALLVDAAFSPARNNLALLYAVVGDTARAFELFRQSAGAAAAHYNLGLVWLARRDYHAALKSFESAYAEDPQLDAAHARARDVRRLLNSEKSNGDDRRIHR